MTHARMLHECCASNHRSCAVLNAYTAGVRADDMADQTVMVALSHRYAFKLLVFQAPRLEALEAAEGARRRNQQLQFRPFSVGAEGLTGNPATAIVFASNMNHEHFEPIVPMRGLTQRPGRFTPFLAQQQEEGWCPILNLTYTSDMQRRQVSCGCMPCNICNECCSCCQCPSLCFHLFIGTSNLFSRSDVQNVVMTCKENGINGS
jgi:hypothetical protein